LDQSIGKRRFAVIDMGDDAKVTDRIHGVSAEVSGRALKQRV
jgi:hypothetical protein